MKTIRHTATLYYYDGPQVFEARDAIGGHYIAVMVDPEDGRDRYLVAGVEPERLRQFRLATLDLRDLLLARPEDAWYLAAPSGGLGDPLPLVPQASPLADFDALPEPGFLLHDQPATAEILSEARARHNLVLDIAVEPPEAARGHRIHAGTLAGLLTHVQTMVKHAYRAALRELAPASRRNVEQTDAHLLDVVVAAAPGSFRVVLEASRVPDLFGQSELSRAMDRVDRLFAAVADPHQTLETVKAHRGHLAGAYLRLLQFLVQNRTGFRYSWAEPEFSEPRAHAVAEAQVGPLVDLLSGVSNLGSEAVVLVGVLRKADVDSGSWRVATEEGDVSGKTREGGPSLAGLKLESNYRFSCLEEIEETQGSGREQRTLYLMEHEPA